MKPGEGEQDTVDGSSPSASSSRNSDSEEHGGKNAEDFGDESLSQNGVNRNKESQARDESILVKSIKTEKVHPDEENIKMKSSAPNSASSTRSFKGKYRHPSIDAMSTGAADEDRGNSSPSPYDLMGCRRESPGPSDSSNGPPEHFSHEQLIQAGLPYLHLLPPSIRNGNLSIKPKDNGFIHSSPNLFSWILDAARFFFMPPNVSPELTAAAVAAMASGPSDGSQLPHKGKKLPPESPVPRPGKSLEKRQITKITSKLICK